MVFRFVTEQLQAALTVAITIRFETGYKIHDNSERQQGDASDGAASLHRVIGEDRAGNIWFGPVEQGPWRYHGKSLRNFTAEDGLTSKGVMAIYKDMSGRPVARRQRACSSSTESRSTGSTDTTRES